MTGWRSILKIHPAADLFPLMSPEELRVLGKDIGVNGLTSPIVLWRDPSGDVSMLDGRSRCDAIELEGRTIQLGEHNEIEVKGVALPQREISDDDGLDPYDYVISANTPPRQNSDSIPGQAEAFVRYMFSRLVAYTGTPPGAHDTLVVCVVCLCDTEQ